jgi:hypothetical protein
MSDLRDEAEIRNQDPLNPRRAQRQRPPIRRVPAHQALDMFEQSVKKCQVIL